MSKKRNTSTKPVATATKKVETTTVDPSTNTTPVVDETQNTTPPVIDTDNENIKGPGDGIDTNGDGNADLVVQAGKNDDGTPKTKKVPEFSYKGKVKLSDAHGDAVDKDEATKLVKDSHINQHFKDAMVEQIKEGKLEYQYAESFRRIKSADLQGSIYQPGSDGL